MKLFNFQVLPQKKKKKEIRYAYLSPMDPINSSLIFLISARSLGSGGIDQSNPVNWHDPLWRHRRPMNLIEEPYFFNYLSIPGILPLLVYLHTILQLYTVDESRMLA